MPPREPGDPDEVGDDHDPVGGPDERDVDDVVFRPPLPPEDRLWRHPSEVGRAPQPVPARSGSGRRTAGVAVLSGLVGAAVAVGAIAVVGAPAERVVERQVEVRAAAPDDDASGVAALVEEASPSVAALVVHRGGSETSGSAVVVRSDGHLVTDAGVVAGAERIDVVLHGGDTGPGEVIGVDDATGLAVVHVDLHGLRPAAFGAADALDVGSRAVLVAATADGGWQAWASSAIVSALDRRVEGSDGAARYGMIVVDEPVVAGAHGGALVDASGAVIGIASPVPVEGTAGSATPIDLVVHVARQLIEHGQVDHVWVGLHGVDLEVGEADDHAGALVEDVVAGSPAADAGIAPGDVVVAVDGEPTPSMAALIAAPRMRRPGDVVELRLRRDGEERRVEVVLAAKPD
ncbi:MAG: S1C family serine protease [Acidimicrobiia bacterium]